MVVRGGRLDSGLDSGRILLTIMASGSWPCVTAATLLTRTRGHDRWEVAVAMQANLDRNDWQTLRLAPFWVLSALAGRYRKFNPLEDAAFWRCMDDAALEAHGIAREAVLGVIADRETVVLEYERDGRPVGSGLGAVVAVLATLPPAEAAHFKDLLFSRVATGLALARGPFGNSISSDDAETLSLIATFLEIETDEVKPLTLASPV
jgi:hypothetical protein